MRTLLLLLVSGTAIAGEFLNLTFDSPNLSGLTPISPGGLYSGPTAQIMKGWSVQHTGRPIDVVFLGGTGGETGVPVTLIENPSIFQTPKGRYSVTIWSVSTIPEEVRISQRGMIPAAAEGLRIFADGEFHVSVNGEGADYISHGTYPVLDISRWAGQTVDLEFRLTAMHGGPRPTSMEGTFDIIGFTSTSVPEPSTSALLGLGAAALVWRVCGGRLRGT